jgi:hypothetical protein
VNVLLVGYGQPSNGLLTPVATETAYIQYIKSQVTWARVMPDLYAVVTTLTPQQMRDQLNAIQPRRLVVYNVTNSLWAGNSLPPDVAQWLQANWHQP